MTDPELSAEILSLLQQGRKEEAREKATQLTDETRRAAALVLIERTHRIAA